MTVGGIEIDDLTATFVQDRLEGLKILDRWPTDDEGAEFILWGKLQAAMEVEPPLDGECFVVTWRDAGPHLAVLTPIGWFDENLERATPPDAVRIAIAVALETRRR
jgi:hypothetical protein